MLWFGPNQPLCGTTDALPYCSSKGGRRERERERLLSLDDTKLMKY